MTARTRDRVGRKEAAAALLLYVPVVVWVYRLAAVHPASVVIGGARVSGVFAWQLWWPFHCLVTGEPFFWTRMLLWPEGTFAFLHTPINEGAGLLLQTLVEPWTALNLLHLFHAWAAAAAAWLLATRLTGDPWASWAAGLVYAFSYYALVQRMLGHLGISTLAFLPLLLLAWLRLEERPEAGPTAVLALAWMGATLTDPYLAWFGAALPLALLLLWRLARRRLSARTAAFTALAVVPASLAPLLAYLPLALPILGGGVGGGYRFQAPPLTSLVDPPFWHPSPAVQAVRAWTSGALGFGRDVGELQLYLGASVLAVIALGAWRGWLRKGGTWGFLTVSGLVLALGPWLRVRGGPSAPLPVPLPYWIVSHLPALSLYRSTNRAVVVSTLGASLLTAMALAGWRRELAAVSGRAAAFLRAALPAAFLLVWGWEFALWHAGGYGLGPVAPSSHYRVLKEARDGALLELPVTYDRNGYQSLNAHTFLLHQAYHRRPMVLGFPSRYPLASLRPTEEVPFLQALTHPASWSRELDAPGGKARLGVLADLGLPTARALRLRFFLLHTDPRAPEGRGFSPRETEALRALLEAAFGPPRDDGRGNLLWIAW